MQPSRIAAAVVVLTLITATPALAHVSVRPSEAPRGADLELAFQVPNERDDAATVLVELELPVPFERVSTPEVDGWTAEVDGTTVRWRDGRIGPGQAVAFPLSVGPLPDGERLVFKVVQTYDSGEVVRWIDEAPDAEHPAPSLSVTDEPPTTPVPPPTEEPPAETGADEDANGDARLAADADDGAEAGVVVVVAAVVALAVAAYVVSRRRRHNG